mgnify:CR=1 FL=1|jgi:ribonuclease BN (tRNA processing enzyme)
MDDRIKPESVIGMRQNMQVDGVSRFMVDAGSGIKDQFHQTCANSDDIELVALSHLHPDHCRASGLLVVVLR